MKRLLIVVDYQNDFVDGALGFPGAEKLAGPIAAKIEAYRERVDEIVWTLDTHRRDYLETREGRNLPVEHCIEGTPGHALYGEIASLVRPMDEVFSKPTFGSAELFEWLRVAQLAAAELGKPPFESIELVGLVSNICVISNAVLAQAACPEVPIIVDAACTASFDPDLNEKALDVLEGLQVEVINRG
ncbi:cysteine hydrolase [Eggerthella guodeyinii]|uniref:nicotinamidase n=2 Tax=Eggerthella TaxID=84111 RepID=A0A6L7IUY9_9ACTN|nr:MULTISPECIES: isochorismatase family cysteine hydrolase [Eggerthella]MBC5583761.1 cysteine hydrolase [Eggerthella hominis]QOS68701.1 cysteine hydrolase [Eggerthella guodeyinii]